MSTTIGLGQNKGSIILPITLTSRAETDERNITVEFVCVCVYNFCV